MDPSILKQQEIDVLKREFEDAKKFLCIKEDSKLYNEITKILKEYERFIKFLEDASTSFSFLQRNKIKDILRNSTIKNLNNYKDALQIKLVIIEKDNKRLLNFFNEIEEKSNLLKEKKQAEYEASKIKHLQGKGCTGITEMALCKQLNLYHTQWAEKDSLNEKLNQIQADAQEIETSLCKRFAPKKNYDALFKSVLKKEKECGALSSINKTLKIKVKRLKVAIEAAEISAYHEFRINKSARENITSVINEVMGKFLVKKTNRGSSGKEENNETDDDDDDVELLERIRGMSIKESESEENSLADRLKTIERPKSFDVKKSFTDDDPLREQEAEMTMDYVEVFSSLFAVEDYEKAAMHAIYSPKGILRTQQTLQYFKNINTKSKKEETLGEKPCYLLNYCRLLMATVSLVGKDPTIWEVIECFKCAVNENRLDLVEFWIAEGKVEVPEPVANILLRSCDCIRGQCCCKAVQVSEVIFKKLACHHELIDVLQHQGRLATAVHWANDVACFSYIDYARMLEDERNCKKLSELISPIHQPHGNRQIIVALVSSSHNKSAFIFTKICYQQHDIVFNYKDFPEWEGSPSLCETFASLCVEDGLKVAGESFVGACMVWCSLVRGYQLLNTSI